MENSFVYKLWNNDKNSRRHHSPYRTEKFSHSGITPSECTKLLNSKITSSEFTRLRNSAITSSAFTRLCNSAITPSEYTKLRHSSDITKLQHSPMTPSADTKLRISTETSIAFNRLGESCDSGVKSQSSILSIKISNENDENVVIQLYPNKRKSRRYEKRKCKVKHKRQSAGGSSCLCKPTTSKKNKLSNQGNMCNNIYRRTFGPTVDETLLVGMEALQNMCVSDCDDSIAAEIGSDTLIPTAGPERPIDDEPLNYTTRHNERQSVFCSKQLASKSKVNFLDSDNKQKDLLYSKRSTANFSKSMYTKKELEILRKYIDLPKTDRTSLPFYPCNSKANNSHISAFFTVLPKEEPPNRKHIENESSSCHSLHLKSVSFCTEPEGKDEEEPCHSKIKCTPSAMSISSSSYSCSNESVNINVVRGDFKVTEDEVSCREPIPHWQKKQTRPTAYFLQNDKSKPCKHCNTRTSSSQSDPETRIFTMASRKQTISQEEDPKCRSETLKTCTRSTHAMSSSSSKSSSSSSYCPMSSNKSNCIVCDINGTVCPNQHDNGKVKSKFPSAYIFPTGQTFLPTILKKFSFPMQRKQYDLYRVDKIERNKNGSHSSSMKSQDSSYRMYHSFDSYSVRNENSINFLSTTDSSSSVNTTCSPPDKKTKNKIVNTKSKERENFCDIIKSFTCINKNSRNSSSESTAKQYCFSEPVEKSKKRSKKIAYESCSIEEDSISKSYQCFSEELFCISVEEEENDKINKSSQRQSTSQEYPSTSLEEEKPYIRKNIHSLECKCKKGCASKCLEEEDYTTTTIHSTESEPPPYRTLENSFTSQSSCPSFTVKHQGQTNYKAESSQKASLNENGKKRHIGKKTILKKCPRRCSICATVDEEEEEEEGIERVESKGIQVCLPCLKKKEEQCRLSRSQGTQIFLSIKSVETQTEFVSPKQSITERVIEDTIPIQQESDHLLDAQNIPPSEVKFKSRRSSSIKQYKRTDSEEIVKSEPDAQEIRKSLVLPTGRASIKQRSKTTSAASIVSAAPRQKSENNFTNKIVGEIPGMMAKRNIVPIETRYAITRVTKYDDFTTYEVMKSTKLKPKIIPCVTEGVFIVKNKDRSKTDTRK